MDGPLTQDRAATFGRLKSKGHRKLIGPQFGHTVLRALGARGIVGSNRFESDQGRELDRPCFLGFVETGVYTPLKNWAVPTTPGVRVVLRDLYLHSGPRRGRGRFTSEATAASSSISYAFRRSSGGGFRTDKALTLDDTPPSSIWGCYCRSVKAFKKADRDNEGEKTGLPKVGLWASSSMEGKAGPSRPSAGAVPHWTG